MLISNADEFVVGLLGLPLPDDFRMTLFRPDARRIGLLLFPRLSLSLSLSLSQHVYPPVY